MVEEEVPLGPLLTAATVMLVLVFLSSGIYVCSEGHGSPKSPAWILFMSSLLALAALVLVSFVRLVVL
jgi:VIT1/CCC1 family predicted Fe2+/Mn2+ transporter